MQLISLDPILVITSLLLRFTKITKYENKRHANIYTIHTNEHKIYPGKPNTRENLARW
jgi:hypothetical protein